MSFCKTNTTIKEGDTVVIYLSFNQLYPIQIKRGLSHHTKYGSVKHVDLIGKKFGSKIQCTQGTVYVLQGSPEIWTISLPHRTQILYTPNISVITLQLELKPGSIVVESDENSKGTGSGSLSHSLIRTIFPSGHLHTFEFHLQRSEAARKEFQDHELGQYATVYHRDVCTDGFGLENVADAVFLDLPSPWKAIQSAKNALKKEGGRICSFSPCIEQVQKTSLELTQLGFTNIFTVESLRRVLSVKKYDLQDFDFNMDWKKKRPQDSKQEGDVAEDQLKSVEAVGEVQAVNSKRKETDNKNKKKWIKKAKNYKKDDSESESEDDDTDDEGSVAKQYTAKPINIQPGHTGFLTFATLLHKEYLKI